MVEGIVGLPGSGKTYWLSQIGLEAMKKNRLVYANYKLKGANYYTDLKQVMEVRKGVILIDEINLICPSRWWDRFPPKLAYWWSQTRKMELDIYWTSQHQDRVDKIVKEITNYIWEVRKLPFNFRIANCYLPEQIGKSKREKFGTKYFHLNKKVWENFNTYERIEVAKSVNSAPYRPYEKNYSRPYIPREIFLKNFAQKRKIFQDQMRLELGTLDKKNNQE